MIRLPIVRELRPAFGLLTRRDVALFCALTLLYAVSESFGVSMIFPVLRYLEEGSAIFEGEQLPRYWRVVLSAMEAIGLPLSLFTLLALAFVAVVTRQVFHFLRLVLLARLQARTWNRLRTEAFDAIVQADLPYLASQRQGALASSLTLEAHRAGETATNFLMLLGSVFLIGIYVVGLLLISPPLALVVAATTIATALLVSKGISKSHQYGERASRSSNDFSASLAEEMSGIRLVKMLAQEGRESQKVRGFAEVLGVSIARIRMLRGVIEGVVEPVFFLAMFAVVYLGAEVFDLSIAGMGLFFVILMRLVPLAKQMNGGRQSILGAMPSLQNVYGVMRQAREARRIVGGTVRFSGLKRGIEFDRVSFAYDENGRQEEVLRDVSLTIPKGVMTAFVGRSGAGKSTLVDLIPRLRDATSGEVRMDDVPIAALDLVSLRRSIGFVAQDIFLFNDTVYNNIAYGLPDATSEAVIDAARRAHAHDFIVGLALGYDTEVGDRGVRLSAGQRQRIGIARVMLQDPDIVILDEPTSALDSESERYIQAGLKELRRTKTLVVIAHRLSTIQNADQIIVLEDGRITEQGDHKTLMEHGGGYSRLFDLQIHI